MNAFSADSPAERVEIAGDRLAATISTLGAELSALTDAAGRALLWDGDPAVWAGRAPILFPIVGGLRDDSYRLGADTYTLPKHGFARRRRFDLVRQDRGEATLRLSSGAETRAAYPFDFRLDIRFSIAGSTLAMAASVSNLGDAPMPFSFGFHPAFRWPLPYGGERAAHRLLFERGEPAPIRRIDPAGLLRPERLPTPVAGAALALDDALFVGDALIFDALESRSLRYGAPGGGELLIEWEGLAHLGIWTRPGAGYICVEPWQGHADPEGFDGTLFDKPSIVVLPAGGERRFAMRVTLPD